jgi:hypothetical protein
MRGKTINIYIPDGDPKGIKICSIDTSIVKAIYVPRNRLELAALRKEIKEPGIYFLFGMEEERSKPIVYIGEAENLLTRLRQHNVSKDFWNFAICFVSEKKNINKAHIKYLENYSCSEAKRIDKCRLENVVTPTQSTLTEQDTDFVLNFFDDLKILLTSLGFPIFEESNKEESNIFVCKGKNASAEGIYEEGGMLVFKGARCNIEETPSFGNYAKRMRRLLLGQGILKEDNGLYILTEDYLFSSPSTASDIILGRSSNGWTIWKSKDAGETLDKRYRK